MSDIYYSIAKKTYETLRTLEPSVRFTETPPSANPSVVIDIENERIIARITIWKFGEAYLEALLCDSDKIIYGKYCSIEDHDNFENEILKFYQYIELYDSN